MDGEEPSFRPQEPPQYRGSSVKRPFAQLNIDDEWPSASGSSGRGSRGLVGGSDGEDSDRHKRARSESESSGDESLASFSATSSSSSQAGSSSSSSSESHESPSAGLPSSYDSVVDTVFVRDDGRNELHILDEHPDLGMRPIEDALAVSRPLIQERRIDASDQINRHEGTEPTVRTEEPLFRLWPYPPLPIEHPSEEAFYPHVWPNPDDPRSGNASRISRDLQGEIEISHISSDLSAVNHQGDLPRGSQRSFISNRECLYRPSDSGRSDRPCSPDSDYAASRIPPSQRQSTLSSRSPGRSIDRGRLPPLPAMESLSSLPRPPLLIAGSFRNEATPSELSPFTGLRSGPAYEDDSGSLLRRSLRRVNHSRSEIGISRPMPSYSESWNAPGDGDDGLQSDMNRIFEDLRSFNETLEAARESVSVFLYGRRTPGYGTEEDRSSGRAAVESRREPLNARQPPLTLFRGRSDSEGESEPLPNNGSISNGTRNTYNPFSTTRSTAPSPSSPDPLDLISSGDHDGSQSRFRLRAVSSRSFTDRRSNESGQASRLPPRLTPRTASRPHRDPLPPAFDDPDEIIIGLDEHPGDWFSPIGSPRTSLASARRPQSESLNGSAARRAGVSRPDPPVGPRSRLGRISPTYDYVPHTSWASSTAASESRSEENPRRLLAEEHMRPFVSSTSFSVPRPPWREGRWRESEDSTGSRPNLPSDSPLVDSSTGRPTLFRNSFGSSYRSTSETPYWRHDGESNIPPAHRRVVHTRLPAILPPLTRAASNRSLPSIATFAENDGNPRDEVRTTDSQTDSAGLVQAMHETSASLSRSPLRLGQWPIVEQSEPEATTDSNGLQHRRIDLNAYHDGPFRTSLQRSVELSRLRSVSQSATHSPDSTTSRLEWSALERSTDASTVPSPARREALTSRPERVYPPRPPAGERERSTAIEIPHPVARNLSQRFGRVSRPSRAGTDRPLPQSWHTDDHLSPTSRRSWTRPSPADIPSPDWWDSSPPEIPDDIWSELNDLPDAMDVDVPAQFTDNLQQALQVLRGDGPGNSPYGRRSRRRTALHIPRDVSTTSTLNEPLGTRDTEEQPTRRTSARSRTSTARPTDLINEPFRRATSQRSQSRSPSRGTNDGARSHFERHARLRAMRSQIRQRQQGQEEVRSRAELPLHTFLASRYRARRNLGDFVRDEDFDSSYETLLALAASVGDALPRSTPEHVIASMPTGFYKDWAEVDTDTRCPICLDDYKSLDPVLKMHDCRHWLHKECLETWLRSATTCPVCRQQVRTQRDRSSTPPVAGPSSQDLPNQSGDEDSDDEDPWRIGEDVEWLVHQLPVHRHSRRRPMDPREPRE